jgi:hypothetical protein
MPQRALASTSASDNFNRANGSLGAGWTDMTDGGEQGLAVSNDAVIGTEASGTSGDIRTGEVYTSDQFSQIEVTSTQYSGGQWIGPAVRAQNGGQDLYLGIYWWNYGNPELGLYAEIDGQFTQLGSFYASGPLAAGTELTLSAIGSALSFSENGVVKISATDPSLTGGAPGIVAGFGTANADNWLGGDATVGGAYSIGGTVSGLAGTVVLENNGGDDLSISANGTFTFSPPLAQGAPYAVTVATVPSGQTCTVANGSGVVGSSGVTNVAVTCGSSAFFVQHVSTDANNVQTYSVTSEANGPGAQTFRVLQPSHPAAGMAHNFIYVLPVEAGLGTTFGDGLNTLQGLDAEDQYNLTIIEPTFAIDPWYADNPTNVGEQYETFMTELQPWVNANLSTSGTEQSWLIGFSKSGLGAEDLILKHPDLFTLAAAWDFPADMSSYDLYGPTSTANYGTDANFQANYRLTQAFVEAHKAPFQTNNRIWIGGYNGFQTDISDYDALLTSEGILHSTGPSVLMNHNWDGGWVPEAVAALHQDSIQIAGGGTTDTINFNSEGGTPTPDNLSGPDGSTVSLPAAPTLAGYSFNGWFAAPSGGLALGSPYTLSGSVTLYAQWIQNATDDYSYAAGTGSGSFPTSGNGLDGTTITLGSASGLSEAGYTFAGWNDGATTYPAGATYTLSSDGTPIIFAAQWTANVTDTVTFNSEGGTPTPGNLSGLDGTTITLPSAPGYPGHAFTGWNTEANGSGTNYSAGGTYTLSGSVTLYAQWVTNYSCVVNGSTVPVSVQVSGNAVIASGKIKLTNVVFSITNWFGTKATFKNIEVHVPDPNRTSAPYKANSATIATTPKGWTVGHGTNLYALHAGKVTVASGSNLTTAAFGAKYSDLGPVGTVISFQPTALTFTLKSPIVATASCMPAAPFQTFAQVKE